MCCAMEMTRQLDTRAPTSLSRGHISVRPETQVMAQHNNTVHHKPPVPTAAPYQYIVLDDLVRRAVQKEWLELDYGAQWWSNDHAPTIYANSKLIPSLSSFLSNRWSELRLILQKRPVAAKKIRLKKSGETSNQQKDCAQTSTPAVLQQANVDAKYNHQLAATQEPSASLSHSSLRHNPHDTTLSMVHSPPDIKPVHLSQLDNQNVEQNNSCSVNQPVKNMLSMPITIGTYDAFTSNNCMENIPDINALIPPSNGHLKPKPSYTCLRNLIEGTYKPCQQNFNENNLQNPFILTSMQNNSLKLKIKLNSSSQVARSKQHKKKVDEINLKKQAEQAGNVVKPKKLKQKPSENAKKRKRRVKIKYSGPHKIKKCSVNVIPLSEEILRKYTGIGIEDMKILYKTIKKRRRTRKKKTPSLSDNLKTTDNCTGTDILCSQPPLNVVNSISSVKTSSDSNQCSSSPRLPVMSLGSTPASPVSSVSIIDGSPLPDQVTTMNDLTIIPLKTTAENGTKTNQEQGKTAHLSVAEKLEILKSDNLSVTSVKRSLSCDAFISLNKESAKSTEVPKLNMETTNQEVSECESSKNSFEKYNEEEETDRSEPSSLATQLEGNQDNTARSELATELEGNEDNTANLNSEQPVTSDNNISPTIKLGIKKINGILKRKERTLSSSPLRLGKLNSDYVNGKIIPLGQKSSPTTIKRRSSEGSFDVPTISSCISLATLPTFNSNQETRNKEQEKPSLPIINSNKDLENGIDASMDLNMNYKNNKLLEKPLTNNISLNKNKLKEPNTIFKDSDTGDSTDSNKENTFIEEPIDNTDETTKKHRLDDDQPQQQSPKRLRIDVRNDDNISKCNLKIDLSRMKLEEETNDEAVIQTLTEQQPKNETEQNKSVEQIERPIMELAAANFVNYSCIRCNGVFMHFKEWKMHYDDGHSKCANVTAQSS